MHGNISLFCQHPAHQPMALETTYPCEDR